MDCCGAMDALAGHSCWEDENVPQLGPLLTSASATERRTSRTPFFVSQSSPTRESTRDVALTGCFGACLLQAEFLCAQYVVLRVTTADMLDMDIQATKLGSLPGRKLVGCCTLSLRDVVESGKPLVFDEEIERHGQPAGRITGKLTIRRESCSWAQSIKQSIATRDLTAAAPSSVSVGGP